MMPAASIYVTGLSGNRVQDFEVRQRLWEPDSWDRDSSGLLEDED